MNLFNGHLKWLWLAILGGTILLAIPGQTQVSGIALDVIGPLFTTCVYAIVPIIGYRFLYQRISGKEITYIFCAAWVFLILSQFFST